MQCSKCNKDLVHVFEGHESQDSTQFENALEIRLTGGYGMFVDPMTDEEYGKLFFVICHECAHDFCRDNEFIREAVEPEHSHSHTEQYRKDNPHHYGWDYLFYKGKK